MTEKEKEINLPLLDGVPEPSGRKVSIHITLAAQRKLRSGHPWLYQTSITKQSHDGKTGDLAVVYDRKGKFLAVGLFDPNSAIPVRVLQSRKPVTIDKSWFAGRVKEAAELRKTLEGKGTTGYRLIHGEDDGLPGLVVDRYGDSAVIKIYSAAWVLHLRHIVDAVLGLLPLKQIIIRMSRNCMKKKQHLHGLSDGQLIYGKAGSAVQTFTENRIVFEADLKKGQKTGFFLDQRENRERVEKLAKGRDVLNIFSYSGGFSLYAARGGAKTVTSVDISPYAIESINRNVALNGKPISSCEFEGIAEDAFAAMERLEKQRRRYGMVIIDPPSFARKETELKMALKAYGKLVILGLNLLRSDGILVMASCSSKVRQEEFFKAIFDSAAAIGQELQEIKRTAHAIDHPNKMRETAYLKCIFLRTIAS